MLPPKSTVDTWIQLLCNRSELHTQANLRVGRVDGSNRQAHRFARHSKISQLLQSSDIVKAFAILVEQSAKCAATLLEICSDTGIGRQVHVLAVHPVIRLGRTVDPTNIRSCG